jgi:hypothetical protein
MKGTILDFLQLAAEKPELAKELADLAARYGFQFSDTGELDENDLAQVAGGTGDVSSLSQLDQLQLQTAVEKKQQAIQTLSNTLKEMSSTQDDIVSNIK